MVWIEKAKINLAVQAGQLRKSFPDSDCWIKRSTLTWLGKLIPSFLSQEYAVRIQYKLDTRPDVELVQPTMERRNGALPDHIFSRQRLCLYLPNANEWNGQMLLVDTIVPWTSEWLFHYEIWLATGQWCGGGIHPGDEPELEVSARHAMKRDKWRKSSRQK